MIHSPRWVDDKDEKASHIEHNGVRLVVEEEKEGLWCLTIFPFFKDKKLPGRTLEEAKYSAVIAARQWMTTYFLQMEILFRAAEKGI